MFQVRRVLEAIYYLLGVLAMVCFSVIILCSAREIGLYLLYRKKVIAAFKLNEKHC